MKIRVIGLSSTPAVEAYTELDLRRHNEPVVCWLAKTPNKPVPNPYYEQPDHNGYYACFSSDDTIIAQPINFNIILAFAENHD